MPDSNAPAAQNEIELATELARSRAALAELQARYRSLVENLPLGVTVHGPKGDVRQCNPKVLALLDVTTEQLVGTMLFDSSRRMIREDGSLFPNEDSPILRVLATGQPVRGVTVGFVRPKSEEQVWLLVDAEPEFSATGSLTAILATFSDITAQRQAGLERDRLFNNSIDPICVAGADGYFKQLNFAWTRVLGWSTAELMVRPWMDFVHPDDREASLQAKATIEGGTPVYNFENRYRHQDGSYRWLQWKATPMPAGESVFAVARDVTESRAAEEKLQASEEKFRAVFESAPIGIGIAEAPTVKFVSLNQKFCAMLGYTEAELLQLSVAQITHPDHREADVRAFRRLLAGEIQHDVVEKRYLRKDGAEVWASRALILVKTNDGASTFAVAMIQDLTDRKRAEAERDAFERQLRQSQKLEAIGTLAGGIAHDFNNILTGIAGFTALASKSAAGNPELGDHLAEITRAGKRAADLVQQILAFSRAGDQAQSPLQWRHVVSESVKLLRAAIPSSIEIETHLAADLPAVLGNATQLHQVMMNLGTNAAHAMRHRAGRLTISLDRREVTESETPPGLARGTYVHLSVSDTGCGMDAKTLDRAFEPFFTTKGPGEGTGLGLSVIHGIVRSHRGEVRLRSTVGEGTTCEIFLPALAAALPTTESPPEAIPRGRGERILLVDDEVMLVKLGVQTLKKLGFTAEGETSVTAALARLERDPRSFDLVFSDQTMPGMTGLELSERLHALRPDLPVILASGYSLTLTAERLRAAGVREVVEKPYTFSSLALAMRRHLPASPS